MLIQYQIVGEQQLVNEPLTLDDVPLKPGRYAKDIEKSTWHRKRAQ
jgi:hypothetical protein